MKLDFCIPQDDGSYRVVPFYFGKSDYLVIDLPNLCYIYDSKRNDHNYYAEYFFYRRKIIGTLEANGMKKMYGAIQKLLQEKM